MRFQDQHFVTTDDFSNNDRAVHDKKDNICEKSGIVRGFGCVLF